jgi:hypothetical protein
MSDCVRRSDFSMSSSSSRPRVLPLGVALRSPGHPSQRPPSIGTTLMRMPYRWVEVGVTPLAAALAIHELGVPSPSKREGMSHTHGVLPRTTRSAATTTSMTPSRPGATLRHSPALPSRGAGALPQITSAPRHSGQRSERPYPR